MRGVFCRVKRNEMTGDRPFNLLISNTVDKAPTIEDPSLSKPDEYKAQFIKQGKK